MGLLSRYCLHPPAGPKPDTRFDGVCGASVWGAAMPGKTYDWSFGTPAGSSSECGAAHAWPLPTTMGTTG